jgi:hypothetical protein
MVTGFPGRKRNFPIALMGEQNRTNPHPIRQVAFSLIVDLNISIRVRTRARSRNRLIFESRLFGTSVQQSHFHAFFEPDQSGGGLSGNLDTRPALAEFVAELKTTMSI